MNILISTSWALETKNGVVSVIKELINTAPFSQHNIFTLTPSRNDPNIWVITDGKVELERFKLIFLSNRYIGMWDMIDRLRSQPSTFIKVINLLRAHSESITR